MLRPGIRGEAYRIAINDLPAWAIEKAAMRFIRGDTPHPKTFAPSTAIFREFALTLLAGIREEIDLIQDILRAKVIPAPPDLYRLPRPGALKWTDIKPEERVGHVPEPPIGKHITDDFMADLRSPHGASRRKPPQQQNLIRTRTRKKHDPVQILQFPKPDRRSKSERLAQEAAHAMWDLIQDAMDALPEADHPEEDYKATNLPHDALPRADDPLWRARHAAMTIPVKILPWTARRLSPALEHPRG